MVGLIRYTLNYKMGQNFLHFKENKTKLYEGYWHFQILQHINNLSMQKHGYQDWLG